MIEPKYYEVEKILKRKKIRGNYKYLIKWKGYSMSETTWEPLTNLENIKKMVDEFDLTIDKKVEKKENDKKENIQIEEKKENNHIEEKTENNQIEQIEEKKEIKNENENENKSFLNKKRKNSESSLKSTEDYDEIKKENIVDDIISESYIREKETNEKILLVTYEKGELMALVERKEKDEKIKKEKIKTKELKKTNPWILVNYYENNIFFY